MLKKIIWTAAIGLLLLVAVLAVRTLSFTPVATTPVNPVTLNVDVASVSQHLSEAIRFQTISYDNSAKRDVAKFRQFIQWVQQTYPLLQQQLELTPVNELTLLYRWKGQDSNKAAVLLSAHYDVVPVTPGTEKLWQQAPFSGAIADGFVWGRGAMDDKGAAVSMLEAITLLLQQGFQPPHDVYLALTHDEEIGSSEGAAAVSALLQQRQVNLAWSLDEGSFVLRQMVPGVAADVASINVAEKGFLNLQLTVQSPGGHSSMPPAQTAVSILALALTRLTDQPVAGGIDGLTADFYDQLGPHMAWLQRMLLANRWLFGPLLEHELSKIPTANAMLRTTTAPTMLTGSIKANVLPQQASAIVNFRLHPRDSIDAVLAHASKVIADPRVELSVVQGMAASRVSDQQAIGFARIGDAARRAYAAPAGTATTDLIVVSGLTIGGTDSRMYEAVAKDSYRFNPMLLTSAELGGFHGNNERISQDNLHKAVLFYHTLLGSL
ncbi:M20 family peptidase [Rheinheimera sp.]|uniref:M20 family peptidase n=1 Tax=Rheinheimera sp. TaxID=1869214 RepID=UPI003D26DCBD